MTACDKFIFADILSDPDEPEEPPVAKTAKDLKGDSRLVNLLRNSVDACADEEGWADLAAVGNQITSQQPDFDSRNYGFGKLSTLFEATELFTVDRKPIGATGQLKVLVQNSKNKK